VSRLQVLATPGRPAPPATVLVPLIAGTVTDTPVNDAVRRDIQTELGPRSLYVSAPGLREITGDRVVDLLATAVASGGFEGDTVFFSHSPSVLSKERLPTAASPDVFIRRFMKLDILKGEHAIWSWGPLEAPPTIAREFTGLRMTPAITSHRGQVEELLAGHNARNPAEADTLVVDAPGGAAISLKGYSMRGQAFLFALYQAVFATVIDVFTMERFEPSLLAEPPATHLEEQWRSRDLPVPGTLAEAIDTSVRCVSAGTVVAAPALHLMAVNDDWSVADPEGIGHVRPTILGALCLQLVAMIATGVPLRQCPLCKDWFQSTDPRRQFCPDKNCASTAAKRAARTRQLIQTVRSQRS